MSVISLLSQAVSTAEAGSHESTLNDAMHGLIERPEETVSAIGAFFQNLLNSILGVIPTILFAIVVLIVGLIVCRVSLKLLSKGLKRAKRVDDTIAHFVSQVAKIVLYVLLITIVLSCLGIPATSIVTVIGTAGVAIGLALQGSLSNVAGGFLLMLNKPFKIGDYIIVGGVEGTVEQISILYTRLASATNQAIFLPNGTAVNATVTNNSCNAYRRVDLTFSISYEDDFEKAQKVITEVLGQNNMVLTDPAPVVRMLEHGASAVVIAVRPFCKPADYWDVYFRTIEDVRAAFIANNISIPFNQLDVHITKE